MRPVCGWSLWVHGSVNGELSMKKPIELRFFIAAIALAEELSFTEAGKRLKLTQPGVSRRLTVLEERSHLKLFDRDQSKVKLTDAGRAFVEEAKLMLVHYERAFQAAKEASEGIEAHLTIGHSPYVDPLMVSTLLAIDLPLHPRLVLHMQSDFAPELVHGLLNSSLDLALITNPGTNSKLTTLKVTDFPFYIALREDNPLAQKSSVMLRDLRDSPWILFDRKVHPAMHDLILRRGLEEGMVGKNHQTIFTADEAIQLVQEGMGVAFLTMGSALRRFRPGIAVRPLVDSELRLEVHLASRADSRSKLVSAFARSFMKRITELLHPPQMILPIPR